MHSVKSDVFALMIKTDIEKKNHSDEDW